MEPIFFVAGIWLFISVIAAVIAYHLDISIALMEICIGVAAAAVADHFFGKGSLGNGQQCLQFLASIGAVPLTFLAGAELDPVVIRIKIKEVSVAGLVGFAAPFAGGMAVAHFVLGWSIPSSFPMGIALSTTSMAVAYAVMIETGLNKTQFGKGILGACFVNDLSTVIALGLMFSPFTWNTLVFIGGSAIVIGSLPTVTKFLTRVYGTEPRPSARSGSAQFSSDWEPGRTGREARLFFLPTSWVSCSRSLQPPSIYGFDGCGPLLRDSLLRFPSSVPGRLFPRPH